MNGKQLKNSILQWAIQGKLVPQDPNDEPASVLLERIREEKARLVKEKKIKKDKNESIIYRGDDNSYYEKFLATGEVKPTIWLLYLARIPPMKMGRKFLNTVPLDARLTLMVMLAVPQELITW